MWHAYMLRLSEPTETLKFTTNLVTFSCSIVHGVGIAEWYKFLELFLGAVLFDYKQYTYKQHIQQNSFIADFKGP